MLEIVDASNDDDDDKKSINLNELEDLIDCEKELKLNDPLLSSFQLFDSPPSSSHSGSVPSSPSSISTVSSTSKRSKCSSRKQSPFEMHQSSDDDFDVCDAQRSRKKNKYYNSSSDQTTTLNLNLKDPMMSASHSPSHFSNDLSYMDHMFFSSSQYLASSLSADDSIDLCTILKTEYDNEMAMIGWHPTTAFFFF